MSLMGIAHGMVWATGQCSCMPRCMHRFWLHTSTMMHASAIGHRGSAPLQACLHATPRASLGLGRTASASLEWHSQCAACWCVLAVRARFGETNEIPKSDIDRSFCRVAGVLRMLGTHTGLSFERAKVSLQHEFLSVSPYSNPLSLHALVAQGQPLIIWSCPLSSRRTP